MYNNNNNINNYIINFTFLLSTFLSVTWFLLL